MHVADTGGASAIGDLAASLANSFIRAMGYNKVPTTAGWKTAHA